MLVCEIIIKWYLNFIACLYFPLVLIRWNSSHCYLVELFKIKESCKEKVYSNNSWKTAWPRMILEWNLFVRLPLRFVWKMLSFVGKHLSFYPKDVCVSAHSLYFLFKWKGVKTCTSNEKYAENEFFNSSSHKKKREKGKSKNISNLKNINSKTPEKLT